MSKKFQVFISSTYIDLYEEREQIIKACLEMGHIPVGMEMFSAADEEQWKTIQRQIDDIDYYVILIAHRYGSITNEGLSYTEKEYDYAVSNDIPVLGFVIDDVAAWPADRIDREESKKLSLLNFKEKIKSKVVNFWKNKDELHAKFSIALMKAIINNPRSGWIKADDSISPDIMKELSRLSRENAKLRQENSKLELSKIKEEDESKNIISVLSKNIIRPSIWYKDGKDWEKIDKGDVSLLLIFEAIAPNLLVENHNEEIANNIALKLSNRKPYRKSWPVPKNQVSHWIADFHALELVEPSKKKHPVADNKDYWSLTKKGRDVIGSIRKLKLMIGINDKEEVPDSD
jgi:Domain of unknown function (DUF4062)